MQEVTCKKVCDPVIAVPSVLLGIIAGATAAAVAPIGVLGGLAFGAGSALVTHFVVDGSLLAMEEISDGFGKALKAILPEGTPEWVIGVILITAAVAALFFALSLGGFALAALVGAPITFGASAIAAGVALGFVVAMFGFAVLHGEPMCVIPDASK